MAFIKHESENYEIGIDKEHGHAYFEHKIHGEDRSGGMWFEGKELTDYDGVCELSKEIITKLTELGFDMSYAE